jgi:hypothetical protein
MRRRLILLPPPPSVIARLARCGHQVTSRADGLFDVANYGTACSAEEVLDLWCWMEIWPAGCNRQRGQWLCGG